MTYPDYKKISLKQLKVKWEYEAIAKHGSPVQQRTLKLFSIAIENYNVDDIRFMIGQEIGLAYLIPVALSILRVDPWVEAAYYSGDLLKALLLVQAEFWKTNIDLYCEFKSIVEALNTDSDDKDSILSVGTSIRDGIDAFLKIKVDCNGLMRR